VWKQLRRERTRVARCTIERLMREMGLRGVSRGRAWKITTRPDPASARPTHLVDRHFTATRPNQLWVARFTYVATWRGFVYVAFVVDVFATHRRMARLRVADDRLRARCPRAGDLRPARRRRRGRGCSPM
jgi:transposase InsO family protein